jgi:hypothetical protein
MTDFDSVAKFNDIDNISIDIDNISCFNGLSLQYRQRKNDATEVILRQAGAKAEDATAVKPGAASIRRRIQFDNKKAQYEKPKQVSSVVSHARRADADPASTGG